MIESPRLHRKKDEQGWLTGESIKVPENSKVHHRHSTGVSEEKIPMWTPVLQVRRGRVASGPTRHSDSNGTTTTV